jgi:uncharacterized membrane protein
MFVIAALAAFVLVFVIAPALAAFVLALIAITSGRATRAGLDALGIEVRRLEARLARLDERLQRLEPPAAEAAAIAPPIPAAEPIAAAPAELPPEPVVAPAAPLHPAPVPASAAPVAGSRWEQVLVENWLVWLGGLTLALGGAFLVKLSIDYGLLTPAVRVGLGVLLGVGLAAGADRLARRESAETGPSHVPPALAAAGAATVFASLYAAYQLYGLIPALPASLLLAATAAATVLMSLRHGPFVAALGLAGAYLVPLLVGSETPQALPLFVYLGLVTAASLAVLRHRAWWWLAWPTLGGDVFWVLVWLGSAGHPPETPIVAGFLLLLLALFGTFRRGVDRVTFLAGLGDAPIVRILTRTAFWVIALATLVLVHVDGFGAASLAAALAAAIFFLWFGYRDTGLDDVIAAAGALPLAVLATWQLPLPSSQAVLLAYARQPVEVGDFATAAIVSALLLGGGGFIAQGRVPRPGRWAALSAAAPLLVLSIAYWRLRDFDLGIGWTALALGLAALELAAAAAVARQRSGETEIELALAAYAIGVLGATILAATFALSNAWLTVALALHLPALGWVEGRIRLPVLRWLASGVAAIVLVRLVLNPYLLDYPLSPTPIFNWLLYGYGVPALAFIAATRQFGSRADDVLVRVLEAGSIAFSALLLTFELRHALYGRLDAPLGTLGRDAWQTLLWLVLAGFLLWLGERRRRPVVSWGGIVLFGMATAQAVIWQALIADPLVTAEPVGRWPVFDVLTLAYALPAAIYAAIVWFRLGPDQLRWLARILAASLAFLWLTLEIRHAFRGDVLTWGECSEAEWYAYSAAWLAIAGAGLAAGLAWRNDWLRRASLAGVGLVVAKVFLSDMAALGGVLRALSFLGLGGALVAIGYAYRRLRPLRQE